MDELKKSNGEGVKKLRMINFIVYIIAFFITVPIIATIFTFILFLKLCRSKKRALHKSINWTIIFYIIAVMILIQVIFQIDSFGYILVVLLTILTIIILAQWKKNTEIEFKKAFRLLWRVCFLLFLFLYLSLLIFGLIMQIVS
ncbi:DUF3397 domain-containing protein [Oceanobacillus senegalensis]|uniref:DUF3397 domain-containing protein n=1 Tax=Oceanobacillus senegalensis TaxID=1936063 RepID=UPI001C4F88AF|nr:DUF3397 domain-containing protein [Oceanobacillus senegalensis]